MTNRASRASLSHWPSGLLILLLTLVSSSGIADSTNQTPASPLAEPLLLDESYPIVVDIAFHSALLHWMDSLSGLAGNGFTAGKTAELHRVEYLRRFGEPSEDDQSALRRFYEARAGFAADRPPPDRNDLTLAFFLAANLDEALRESAKVLDSEAAEGLSASMRHFAPRYRKIWQDGRIPRRFLERSRSERDRQALGRFLVQVARFYTTSPALEPAPRLVLVPVARGAGTHAQAIGHFLLIELREGETMIDQVAPIVHENAHLLFNRLPAERRDRFRAIATSDGGRDDEVWRLLGEALPTAIAQGVADRKFNRAGWSRGYPWYHIDSVDAYAKRIFPAVKEALDKGRELDESMFRELVAAAPGRKDRAPRSLSE